MGFPIRINTKYGFEQFNILSGQFAYSFKYGVVEKFRARCKADYMKQKAYLEHFLDDKEFAKRYRMDEEDVEGFRIFNEQSDVCSCLQYFSGEMYGQAV